MFILSFSVEIMAMVIGFLFYKKNHALFYKMLLLLLVLTVSNEGLSHYGFYKNWGINKMLGYNIFFILQFCLTAIMYISVLDKLSSKKTFMFFGGLVIIIALVLLFNSGWGVLNADFISLICLAMITCGFSYLYKIYATEKIFSLKTDSLFWFSLGMIITQFLLLLYINALRVDTFRKDEKSMDVFKIFNNIGNVIYYLCISYSFICYSIFRKRASIL
jgi:hypothetical protein